MLNRKLQHGLKKTAQNQLSVSLQGQQHLQVREWAMLEQLYQVAKVLQKKSSKHLKKLESLVQEILANLVKFYLQV